MPVVKLSDGTHLKLSDNPTPEELAIVEADAKKAQGESGVIPWLKRRGEDALRGLGNSAAGVMDMLGANGSVPIPSKDEQGRYYKDSPIFGRSYLPDSMQKAFAQQEAEEAAYRAKNGPSAPDRLRALVKEKLPEPNDSGVDKLGRRALETVAGGLIFRGGATPSGAVSNAAGSASSDVAAQMLGDYPAVRFLAGLVGGGAASLGMNKVTQPRTQTAEVAREALEGITETQLKAAQQFQANAARQGVRLDLAQALEGVGVPAGNLTTIRNALANRREGNQVQSTLHGQSSEVQTATEAAVNNLPGANYGLPQAANNAQEAATARVNQAKQARTAATAPLFEAAGPLPPQVQQAAIAEIDQFMQQPSLSDAARGAAQQLRAKLVNATATQGDIEAARQALASATTPSAKLAARQQLGQANAGANSSQPIESGAATRAIKDTVGPYKPSPLNPIDAQASGQVQALAARVKGQLKQHGPLGKAEQAYADFTNAEINPLLQGPVGSVATPRGYQPDRAAAQGKVSSLLENGRDPSASVSPIKVLGNELGKVDPSAFPDVFKSWLSDKVAGAIRPTAGVEASAASTAKSLYDALAGNSKRWQGIRDGVEVVSKQAGVDVGDTLRGLENLRLTLKAASNRPARVGGLAPDQLEQMAGNSLSADTLRLFGFLPFEKAARGVEARAAAETFRTFDDLLTSPDGAATLAKLGRTPVMSRNAQAILQGFITGDLVTEEERARKAKAPGGYPPAITPQ